MEGFLLITLVGLFLGMRHATDADHVVAIATIITRQRDLRHAALTGLSWGLGHSLTILLVGASMIQFGITIPALLGRGAELPVSLMLIVLGTARLAKAARSSSLGLETHPRPATLRSHKTPLMVGVVHGLAGSAAITLAVLATIPEPRWAMAYLVVFGVGTIAGMMVVTVILASAFARASQRHAAWSRWLGFASGVASLGFGLMLAHRVLEDLLRKSS
jgi:high-affinity nickel-transport protein